jgi:myo-inositol-1(or 4)-monophosphatase
MKPAELKKITAHAIAAAHKGGEVLMKYYRKKLHVHEKARSSLVTEADLKSEAVIQKSLKKAFPDFQFLGEESGDLGRGDPTVPTWHVDPLDGTTNFVHGFPMFCVSIGLALGEEPIMGVIYIPTVEETFSGFQGGGAYLNKKRMHVSKRNHLSQCLLTTGFAYVRDEDRLSPEIERFEQAHLEARAVRRPGAAAIDLAYVAAGVFDAFWERNLSSWDVCAGALLVREAGGRVTGYGGQHFTITGREVLATNTHIHTPMMQILR